MKPQPVPEYPGRPAPSDCGGMPHSVLRPHHSEPFLLGSAFGGNLPPLARHPRRSHSASLHNWHVACSGSRSVDRAETLTRPTGETCITTSYGASEDRKSVV